MKSITRPWMIGTKFQIDGSPRPWIVRKVDNPKRPAKKWTSFDTDNPSIRSFKSTVYYGSNNALIHQTILLSCRYTGVVTGISESDPIKWPNSKWKCLMVSCIMFFFFLFFLFLFFFLGQNPAQTVAEPSTLCRILVNSCSEFLLASAKCRSLFRASLA